MFSQTKERKHTEQNFHSVAKVMPRGGTSGCWGESKTLAWGFAMAPHRLHTLVVFGTDPDSLLTQFSRSLGALPVKFELVQLYTLDRK